MKTGEVVSDGQARSFTTGELLGRGSWGTSWLVRDGQGRELVAKVALGPSDLLTDVAAPDGLLLASRSAVIEQADLLKKATLPFLLPKFEGLFTLPDGRPVLLTARYSSSLKKRLSTSLPLREAIGILAQLARGMQAVGRAHGNLRPSNIFFTDRGEPVLADWATPALNGWKNRLAEHAPDHEDYAPQESAEAPRPTDDTWAMCVMLWRATSAQAGPKDARRDDRFLAPKHGLDKVEVSSIRDKVLNRVKEERTNPRFAPRLAERLGALLNRGLAPFAEPSPPYRFEDMASLRPRLDEITELIQPRVENIGQFLLGVGAKNGTFGGAENPPSFSVTIGCSSGINGHEDVACGLQIHDLDKSGEDGKLLRISARNAQYSVKAHPSKRLRFDFAMPDLPPGRYRASVAFSIKEGDAEPTTVSGEFEVRPPPGYIPPVDDSPVAPIAIPLTKRASAPSSGRPQSSTSTGTNPDLESQEAEVVVAFPGTSPTSGRNPEAESSPRFAIADDPRSETGDFPRPISPSSPGEMFNADFRGVPNQDALSRSAAPPGATWTSDVRTLPGSHQGQAVAPDGAPLSSMVQAPDPSVSSFTGFPAPVPNSHAAPSGVALSNPYASPRPMPSAMHAEKPMQGLGNPPSASGTDAGALWSAPVDWDDVEPGPEQPAAPGLSVGDDLPSWASPRTSGGNVRNPVLVWIEKGLESVRSDMYTAFMVGIVGALVLLLLSFLLIGSC